MDYFLDRGLDGDLYSFRNADDIRLRWRQMNYTYGLPSLFPTDEDYCMWNHKDLPNVGPIFYRDIVECIKLLLRHPPFMEHLIFALSQEYNESSECVYSDLHTADGWWKIQAMYLDGATIIPVICASDESHLTNFSGDKSIWPLYMTIGNIPKDIRREKSSKAWICIGLLPTLKLDGVSSSQQWHSAVHHILEPIRTRHCFDFPCSDGYIRQCYPILNGWVANFPKQCTVALVKRNRCPACTVPTQCLGDPKPPHGFNLHDPQEYLSEPDARDETTARARMEQDGVHSIDNLFLEYPACNPFTL